MVSQNNRKVIEMNYLPSLRNYSNSYGNTKKGEKKYIISEKNPWLNPKDNFGKLEKGKV